jgi:hypothetical protein
MAIIEESIDIKCPVDRVFAYTMDAKRWPEWQSAIIEAEQTSPGQMAVGTTLRWTSHRIGLRVKATGKVTDYELNKRWSKTIVTRGWVIEDNLSFDPVELGTKFTLRWDMKIAGFLKLFSPMLVRSARKSMKAALNSIKGILEAETRQTPGS